MRLILPLAACIALSACAESPSFRHATYLPYAYQYDEGQLPILNAKDDPGYTRNPDHFSNPWRGRNWR